MDILVLLKALQRHFLLFLFIIFCFTAIGFLINTWMIPQYQAKTTLISSSIPEDNRDSRYSSIMANQLLTKTYEDAMQSLYIASDVKSKLSTSLTPAELLRKVKVKTDPQTLVIQIYANSGDPREAVAISNAFAASFVNKSREIINNANVTLLDLATYENSSIPVSPKKELNLAICTCIGVFVGMSVVLSKERRKKGKADALAKRYAQLIANQNLS